MEQNKPVISGGNRQQPSTNLLEKTTTNVIINPELARGVAVLKFVYGTINDKDDNFKWLAEFADLAELANHNIDGVPRQQFIQALQADSLIQQEVEKRRLLAVANNSA